LSNWPLAAASRFETIGAGTTVTSGGANAYGTPVSIGTTSFAWSGFFLDLTAPANGSYRITITLGSGGPTLVEDLFLDFAGNSGAGVPEIWCPVHVPSGAALYAKIQCSAASSTLHFSITGYRQDFPAEAGFSRVLSCTDFTNTVPANSVTETGNTVTGLTVIRSSLPARMAGLWVTPCRAGDSSRTASDLTVDVCIGGAGAEQVLATRFFRQTSTFVLPQIARIPCDLPSGTRLSFRVACGNGSAADSLSMAAWGAAA